MFPPSTHKGWPPKKPGMAKIPMAPKPKSDFGELEEIGAKKAPMPKRNPMMMADGGMPDPGAGGAPPPDMPDDGGGPPPDLDPLTLHYLIGVLQEMLDATTQQGSPDDDMTGGAPPPPDQDGGGAQ